MTSREFVNQLWSSDSNGAYTEPMTLETARTDIANYTADGWDLPDDLTPELYMELWNELLTENSSDD